MQVSFINIGNRLDLDCKVSLPYTYLQQLLTQHLWHGNFHWNHILPAHPVFIFSVNVWKNSDAFGICKWSLYIWIWMRTMTLMVRTLSQGKDDMSLSLTIATKCPFWPLWSSLLIRCCLNIKSQGDINNLFFQYLG